MKKVFAIEVIKDITGEICISRLEMHPSWQMKAGKKLFATKSSETHTYIHLISGKDIISFLVPIEFAQEYFKILGEAKGPEADRVFKYVNQEAYYN